jgi:hypothetical protein
LTRLRSLVLIVPLALLAGCHKSAENDKRSATGEVLEGTTSDAMIPLGQLTSQPPLLPHQGKSPTTPEQAVDQGATGIDVTDVGSETSDTTASPAPTPSAPASATP